VGAMPGDDDEVLSALLNAAYLPGSDIPTEIVLSALPADAAALEEVLSERRGRKVSLRVPSRGDTVRLVELAVQNAQLRYERDNDRATRLARALEELGRILELPGPPHRIECFDNSNLQGTAPVAAMSVFLDGAPARAEYRRYRVKTVVGADDYATMREILGRRIRRAVAEGTVPDLIVVDGGRGQLASALAALDEVRSEIGIPAIPMVGIAKPRTEHARGERDATDKIVLPQYKEPLRLRAGDPSLRILQHIRDEVHDHAVKYHRKVRDRKNLLSVLEAIPGVGPARRKVLLKTLGSAHGVAEADEATLAAVPGIGPALAAVIHAALNAADDGALG
jgi:excinuclease ABC subunit C